MSYLRPDNLNPLTIAVSQAATLGGMLYSAGMVATGMAALPAAELGTALFMSELGSGLLLGAVSFSGFMCARTADHVRRADNAQIAALRTAEKTGVLPERTYPPMLDAFNKGSPLLTTLARWGGVWLGLAGTLGLIGGAMAGTLAPTGLAMLAVGMSTYKASRAAEDANSYAEEKIREASRAMNNITPSVGPVLEMPELSMPEESRFAARYLAEQVAMLEEGHTR